MAEQLFHKADGILDLRNKEDYMAGHLSDSTSMPFAVLPESLNQLPAAPATLFLVGDQEEIEAASVLLDQKGYSVNGSLILSAAVRDFWQKSLDEYWVTGKESKRLWRPSPVIQEWVDNYLPDFLAEGVFENARPSVLDLGCGGGRDAVFLARQKMQVIAIDKESRVLKRAKSLAQANGAQVQFKCCDLSDKQCLPQKKFDLIVGVRYLNRKLLSKLPELLNSGGFLLWETFVVDDTPLDSPKNPNSILQPGELAETFRGLHIIIDRIQKLPDGRPVNAFIARKSGP